MKRITAMMLAAVMGLSLTACNASEKVSVLESAASTQAATLPEVPEGAITDESGSFVYDGPLR